MHIYAEFSTYAGRYTGVCAHAENLRKNTHKEFKMIINIHIVYKNKRL